MAETQQLVARVRALADKNGVSPKTLSRKLFGSGARLAEIEAGSSLTLATYSRTLAILDEMERNA